MTIMSVLLQRSVSVPVTALPLVLSILLAGCGGGNAPLYNNATFSSAVGDQTIPDQPQGSSRFVAGNGSGFPNQDSATPALNRDDAPLISGSVLSLINTVGEVGSTGNQVGQVGGTIFTGLRRATRGAGLRTVLGRVLGRLAASNGDSAAASPTILAVAHEGAPQTTFNTQSCDGDASGGSNPFGGSYDIQSFSSQGDKGFFLSGNVMTVNFYDCIISDTTLNGGFNISDFLFQDDAATSAYDPLMSGTISFNGFSLSRDQRILNLATGSGGSLDYRSQYRAEQLIMTRIASGALTISSEDNVNDRLQDLVISIDFDDNNATYSLLAEGDIVSSITEDKLIVATLFPLRWQEGDSHPYGGALRITDSEGASLTVTALDMSLVRLEVDEDGDGTMDSSDTLAWSALPP
ncbi:MAG: hypothetical protein ACE5ET_05060 [Gammaproteobacteria bacterium]